MTGSPFQFTVDPVRRAGADKVIAVGEGVKSATTSKRGELNLHH